MNASIDASIQILYNEIVIGYMLLNIQRFARSLVQEGIVLRRTGGMTLRP